MGGRLRRYRTEQRLSAAQDTKVGHVIAGDGDGEVAQDDAGIVGAAALASRRRRSRKRRGESELIDQLDQQINTGVRDEPLTVRPDFRRW